MNRLSMTPAERRERGREAMLAKYMEHHAASLALLARISEHLANHDDAPGDSLNWGHVGDAAETHRALKELSDRLFNEGEYTQIACTRCGKAFHFTEEDRLARHYAMDHSPFSAR